MRNIIVHDYSDIDLPTIWDAIQKDLLMLRKAANSMPKNFDR